MVPIKKSISFSGTKDLRLALKAEINNLHQNLVTMILTDQNETSGNVFKLVFEFDMSTNLVKKWKCKGEYKNGASVKEALSLGEKVEPVSLEVLYYSIITDVEKLYSRWLKLN
ncbi:hypothetical protein GCM10028791_36970 [Echinicola sediminis]